MHDKGLVGGDSGIFEASFRDAAVGTLFINPDLCIVCANQALAEMLGHEALAGLDILQLVEREDRDAFREGLLRLGTDARAVGSADIRLVRADGATVWARMDGARTSQAPGFVLHFHDITTHRRLDTERALTVEVFDILGRMDEPVLAARAILSATRRALGIEAAAIRLAREGDFNYAAHEGFPPEFITAENCLRALDESGKPATDEQGRPVLECTCGQVLLGRTDPNNPIFTASGCVCVNDTAAESTSTLVDLRVRPRDRCVHCGYRSVALIPIRSKQKIIGLLQLNDRRPNQLPLDLVAFLERIASSVGIALERKRAQDRLARSYELLTQAHAATRSGHWSWNVRRNTVEWSESYYTLVGLKPNQVKPSVKAWLASVHPDDRARVQEVLQETATNASLTSGPIDLEWRSMLPDGTVRWLMSRCYVDRNADGEAVGCTGIALDITERKVEEERRRELERQVGHLQRLEGLGRLAGGVAHDMNNVLGVILAIGSLLEDTHAHDPTIAKDAQALVQAASRGRDLVKGLRDFSRKELQSASALDLNEIARREAALMERTSLKRIAIGLDLEPDLPRIFGEATTVQNALMNLCVNAMDAMPNKGTLTLRTRRLGDAFVELLVEDDGEGMPPAVQARALEPFFTTKPVGKGTGLGLSQVYGTMKAHGGTVHLESTVGKGTRVRLAFPVLDRHPARATSQPAGPSGVRPMEILVIDDEELLHAPVLDLLRSLGHSARAVTDGRQALSMVDAGMAVDLVVLDLNMPGLDGVEVLRQLRHRQPDLPVLLATGHSDERIPAVLSSFPGVRILMKPFTRLELKEALATTQVRRAS